MKKKSSSVSLRRKNAIIWGVVIFIITTYICLGVVAEAFVKAANAALTFYLTPSELKVITNEVYIKLLIPFAIYPVLGILYVFFTRSIWSKKAKGILVISSILLSFTPMLLFLFLNNSPFVKYLGAKQAEKILERHDGLNVAYYPNGKLLYEENYKNGVRDGVQRRYFENGQLEEEQHYVNGKQNGLQKSFHENGKLYSLVFYIDGEREGIFKVYDQKGKLIHDMDYIGGKVVKCRISLNDAWCSPENLE